MEVLIIFLAILVVILAAFSIFLLKRNKYYSVAIGNMSGMVIMQRMFELMASTIPASKKIEELNNIIIEVFNSKSSTISIFDGANYEIKASNVEAMYLDSIKALAEEQDFKNNSAQNISKYMVAAGGRLLGYKSAMERKIRSAMFSPIYYNGLYLGFWLLEDDAENAYDSISKEELAKLKDHIGVFIENVLSQESIESAYNTDKQTGFYNNLYLYSTVRGQTSKEDNSSLTLIGLSNLPKINEDYGREVGNKLIAKFANLMREVFNDSNIFVRYSGGKFCIVSPGTSTETLHPVVERFLTNLKMQQEVVNGEKVTLDVAITMKNIYRQSNIDREIAKMSDYVEAMTETNTIKII
ncbi:MAG: diguanylate cyclase [Clostridia bacterium]|nr:diguanylate cyclase [Clostridia bacterium]